MAELIYRHMYKVDVANDPLIRRDVGALLGLYDKAANRFGVELYDNGTALTLSGKTVTGYMIRPDGVTVDISGTVSGNQAYVELKENCYLYDGAFTLSLKVDEQTVLICDGQIAVTRTGTTVNGNEVINTVSSAEMLGGKPPEYYLTPVNLLDNSWFGGRYVAGVKEGLVYQAGLNAFHGANKYPMDRWMSWNADVTFADGCITPGSPIAQLVDRKQIDTSKTYTIAICLADGTIKCEYGIAGTEFGSYDLGIYTSTVNESTWAVWLNTGFNIRWAGLYEGAYTAETLPPYVPKPYAVELAECQRYAVDVTNAILPGVVTQNGVCLLFLPLPVGLRQNANPTVTLKNNLYAYTSGENYALAFSQAEIQKTGVKLTFTCSSTVNTCATVPDFNAFIAVDL